MAKIAITGAFSYSGKYITEELLAAGHEVITLTGNPNRPNPFGGKVKAFPFHFDDPEKLVEVLRGVDTLINTYWVRFDHGETTFLRAVSNIRTLFRCAKQVGVKRVVHISITNPDPQSKLPYFWGKAILEEDLTASGISYAILRPTVIFGKEDILINNIAWFLRRFPLFALPGQGDYRLQPIYVADLANLAAAQAVGNEDVIIDAIGPEIFTFREMLEMIRTETGSRALLLPSPPGLARWLSAIVGRLVKDVVLTEQEV
ncbi:MAG: SDR family oxidoreductase, partial [Anaerolineales bacterium]